MVIKQRQKKPKKEESWRDKYLDAKAEIKKLRKQVSSLRKMLGKSDIPSDLTTSTPDDIVETTVWEYYCPKCNGHVDLISAGRFTFWACNNNTCKAKGRLDEQAD